MAKKAQQKGPAYEVTSNFSHTTIEETGGQSLPAPNDEQEEQRAETVLETVTRCITPIIQARTTARIPIRLEENLFTAFRLGKEIGATLIPRKRMPVLLTYTYTKLGWAAERDR
eukprot:COSAG02_NODE_6228_length_3712_cov_2.222530_2_plen_114_part_00